jgi:SAM-dependent methyltransferase
MDFVKQSHWDKSYKNLKFSIASDRVTTWLNKFLQVESVRKPPAAFEFGCFPGRYLAFIGTLGYDVSGCDLTPRTEELSIWLASLGVRVGNVVNADALSIAPTAQYDLVYSIGFIEHFSDYSKIIEAHDKKLRPGGSLILACPNFRGTVQNYLHRTFDRQNLDLHNLEAMDPSEWKRTLEVLGYKVEFAGFFGGFDFWTDNGLEKMSLTKRSLALLFKIMGRAMSGIPDREAWSPYVGLVARKCNSPAR